MRRKIDHDIIIVGAGPAGSTAAITLAKHGHDVLLIDKENFPRDKVCGDGLPPGTMEILKKLGLREQIQQNDFFNPIDSFRVSSPNGMIWQAKIHSKRNTAFCIAPRQNLDYLLQQYAIKSGAKFRRMCAKTPIIKDETVIGIQASDDGTSEELFARIIIAADGVNSIITRCLRKNKQKDAHKMIALRAYIHGLALNPHEVELYFRKETLPGYVWIFPLNETRANIGLGMMMDRYRKIRKNLKEILFEFLEREMKHRLKNGWKLNDISAAPLKLASQPGIKRVYNGAILVGDAAALIDPLSGEGILNALHSGKIAGEVIHNAISHGDVTERALSEYDNRLRKELWGIIRRSYLLQKTLFASPKLIDWLLKGISKNSFILNIANDFSVDFTYEPMESD